MTCKHGLSVIDVPRVVSIPLVMKGDDRELLQLATLSDNCIYMWQIRMGMFHHKELNQLIYDQVDIGANIWNWPLARPWRIKPTDL
jgi:hypothetical protein